MLLYELTPTLYTRRQHRLSCPKHRFQSMPISLNKEKGH